MLAILWQSSSNLLLGSHAWDVRQVPLSMGNIWSVIGAMGGIVLQNAGQMQGPSRYDWAIKIVVASVHHDFQSNIETLSLSK